jgi:hypothetical protein
MLAVLFFAIVANRHWQTPFGAKEGAASLLARDHELLKKMAEDVAKDNEVLIKLVAGLAQDGVAEDRKTTTGQQKLGTHLELVPSDQGTPREMDVDLALVTDQARLPYCTVKTSKLDKGQKWLMSLQVPPISEAPADWAAATAIPVHPEVGDCYAADDFSPMVDYVAQRLAKNKHNSPDQRMDHATCCCGFWEPGPEERNSRALTDPAALACNSSTANAKLPPKRRAHVNGAACDFVIALSGSIHGKIAGGGEKNPLSFASKLDTWMSSAGQIPAVKSACVVVHARAREADIQAVTEMLNARSEVIAYVIEGADDDAQAKALISTCTDDGWQKYFSKIGFRKAGSFSGFWDNAHSGSPYMYRHMWLAHRLARDHAPNAELVVRGRVDQHWNKGNDMEWHTVKPIVGNGSIAIPCPWGQGQYKSRLSGVPPRYRCAMDDQFAIGPAAAMDGYASTYYDFHDFMRFLPVWRRDQIGHVNERILTAHLHYRGVHFEDYGGDGLCIHC